MKRLLYSYAEDEEGNWIHINDAVKGLPYYSIVHKNGEKRLPMIVKDSSEKIRRKHFAHQVKANDTEAHLQSYIHLVWKSRIKNSFDNSMSFPISYFVYDTRNAMKVKRVDLKKLYNTCEEERGLDGFIGDLKLTHSSFPDRRPMFIEIAFKNDCSNEKKNSGIKIVEIKVENDNEEEIELTEHLDPGKQCELNIHLMNPYIKGTLPRVRFYGFKRIDEPTMGYFTITQDQNGVLTWKYEAIEEIGWDDKYKRGENVIFEISIEDRFYTQRKGFIETIFLANAWKKGVEIKDCRLCKWNNVNCKKKCIIADNCSCYDIRGNIGKLAGGLSDTPHSVWKRETGEVHLSH